MKKIYIIDSELILRTNNHRLRQEFGEVVHQRSISADGTTTIFTTKAVIREINYVTVNGLVLTEGVHYVLGADKGTVRIMRGSCEKEPKSYYCPGKLLCRTS
jgi:hypothetical protein